MRSLEVLQLQDGGPSDLLDFTLCAIGLRLVDSVLGKCEKITGLCVNFPQMIALPPFWELLV